MCVLSFFGVSQSKTVSTTAAAFNNQPIGYDRGY